jgi:hypothetical protein
VESSGLTGARLRPQAWFVAILTVGAHGTAADPAVHIRRVCAVSTAARPFDVLNRLRAAPDLQWLRNQIDPRAAMASSATRELR